MHEFFTQKATTPYALECNSSSKCFVKCGIEGLAFNTSIHFPDCQGGLVVCNASGLRIFPKNRFIDEREVDVAKIRHYRTKTISEFIAQKTGIVDWAGLVVDRTVNNRFFPFCERTKEKMEYANKHCGKKLNMTLISVFYDASINPMRKVATMKAVKKWMRQK